MTKSITIIGAGITGLACARQLQEAGLAPVILEKSRGLGGRIATRRLEDGIGLDHGAQYLTAQSDAFKRVIDAAVDAGDAAPWRPQTETPDPRDLFVGAPAMNSFLKPWAEGIDIRRETRVATVERHGQSWRLRLEDGNDVETDIVVSTAPAPQARDIFAGEPGMLEEITHVETAPCWSALYRFDTPINASFDTRRLQGENLYTVIRNASKPGRGEVETWTLHMTPTWSVENLERTPENVLPEITAMFAKAIGTPLPEPVYAAAHRWRYAMTVTPVGKPFVTNDNASAFIGGDWLLGARIEFGFQSGTAIADKILETLA